MPGLPPERLLCIFGLTKPPMLTSGSRFSTFSDEKVQRSSNVSSRIACALLNRFVWRVTTCYVASFFGVHCPIRVQCNTPLFTAPLTHSLQKTVKIRSNTSILKVKNDCYGKTTLSKALNRLRPSADLTYIPTRGIEMCSRIQNFSDFWPLQKSLKCGYFWVLLCLYNYQDSISLAWSPY